MSHFYQQLPSGSSWDLVCLSASVLKIKPVTSLFGFFFFFSVFHGIKHVERKEFSSEKVHAEPTHLTDEETEAHRG